MKVPIRWLTDESFNNDIVRAVLRRNPELDVVRAQDAGLGGVGDREQEGRIILTHDVSTLTGYAYARVVDGERMQGVVEVTTGLPMASVVEDVLLLSECSLPAEWEGRVIYLPLR